MKNRLAAFCASIFLLLNTGCASVATGGDDSDLVAADPYEETNRQIYTFNSAIDKAVLKPVAQAYRDFVPTFARTMVASFFNNLGEPLNLVNNAAQGKPGKAGRNVGRFVVNTTAGILGFFDMASKMGIARADEDFGQTIRLATDSSGAYIVLPLLGPSSTEDAFGTVGSIFAGGYVSRKVFDDEATENVLIATEVVHRRSEFLDFEEVMGDSVFDEYSFVRDAYLERRRYLTADEDE